MSYNRDEAMRLVDLAEKATQGPWSYCERDFDDICPGSIGTTGDNRIAVAMQPRYAKDWDKGDGAFLAAAPDLAAQLAAAVAEIDRLTQSPPALNADAVAALDRAFGGMKDKMLETMAQQAAEIDVLRAQVSELTDRAEGAEASRDHFRVGYNRSRFVGGRDES